MFVVRIEMKVRPEERDTFRDFVTADGLSARNLAGCIDYSFCEEVGNPQRVLLYEEWATREEFEAYRASSAFLSTGARLRPLLAEPPKSAYYESEDVFSACAIPR
jgi:quinol monooxygenase YgiN